MSVLTLQQRLADDVSDRYIVEGQIARGGMAVVYRALDRKHDRRVAIKVLDPAAGLSAGDQRFHREIAVLARLQHPHILPLHDSGVAAGSLYYVMPFVEGMTLRERLATEGRLPLDDALRIAVDLADALAYAHGQGVAHRDIKPENVILSGYPPAPGSAPGNWHALLCDFGIARLTRRDLASSLRITGEHGTWSGHAIGTPIYMSPEQASGERHVDGRTDIWALGVVLYEMLTGQVPFADAPLQAEALRRRLSQPPPGIRAKRPLPRPIARRLDAVLARACAPDPAQRYQSAPELSAALRACLDDVGASGRLARRRLRRAALLAGGGVAVAALALYAVRDRIPSGRPVDPSLVAVLPFGEEGPAPSPLADATAIDGGDAEQLILDAFARWTDLRTVGVTRVNDLLAREGVRAPRSLEDAVDMARRLGAGQLVWGVVRPAPPGAARGGVVVSAGLYDVLDPGASLRELRVTVRPDIQDVQVKFAAIADSLLLGRARSPVARQGALQTASWNAWRAYDRGHDALAQWDLPVAAREFATATTLDPEYALAHLWRAQALGWMANPPAPEWRAAAGRAAALSPRLGGTAGLTARALAALAEQRYPEACRLFGRLIERDSLDFAAWYGLGDCQYQDSLVVRDAASPSGWRFRASYDGAVRAYQHVLGNLPSVHRAFGGTAVTRLPRMLAASRNQARIGWAVDGVDTLRMAAMPELRDDTLAFVPWPMADFAAARPQTMPATREQATARNRARLLDVAERWVAAFPRSVEVQALHVHALESLGRVTGSPDRPGALEVARASLALPGDAAVRRRLALAELRLLCKLQRWPQARVLADSLLGDVRFSAVRAAPSALDAEAARDLAPVAALTGRAGLAATLARAGASADDDAPEWPLAVREAAAAHLAWAAQGGPRDSLLAARARLDAAVAQGVPRERQDALRRTLYVRGAWLAFPSVGAPALAGMRAEHGYLVELEAAAARRDWAAVRARFAALQETRVRGGASGPVAFDAVYPEAWLHVAAGDTTAALAVLDGVLEALPSLSTSMLGDVAQAGAFPRALRLRAELARRQGDAARAARLEAAVAALTGGGA